MKYTDPTGYTWMSHLGGWLEDGVKSTAIIVGDAVIVVVCVGGGALLGYYIAGPYGAIGGVVVGAAACYYIMGYWEGWVVSW
jgi:hypothetical protein